MKRRNKTHQRGVALLMALGFLSLLLVMGIAFVTNATVARKSAANFRARTQAKSIADSAANRLMASIVVSVYDKIHNAESGAYTPPVDMVSLKNADDSDENHTLIGEKSLLTTIVYGEKFIPRSVNPPKWEYWYSAYEENGTGGIKPKDDARIIGRTAFMALSQTAVVNFSEVMRGCTETQSGTVTLDADDRRWSRWNARRGASIRELCIEKPVASLFNRFKDEKFDESNTGRPDKQDFAVDKNTTENTTDFQSYDEIFTAQDIAVLGTDDEAVKTQKLKKQNIIRSWLLPSGYNEPEIYAFNQRASDTDRYSEMTTFYHRFDLSRVVGDVGNTSIWDTTDTSEKVTVDTLLGLPEQFKQKEKNHKVSRAIPYLKTIVGGGRSAHSPENLRKQVAANLIDYCDKDNIPTSDSTDWEATAPNYTGNDKTPYINEIMISPSVGITRTESSTTSDGNTTYTYTYAGTIDMRMIAVELINLYETNFPNCDISIKGECTLEIAADDQDAQTTTVAFDIPLTGTPGACTETNGNYAYKILYTEGSASGTVSATPGWSEITTTASATQLTDPVKLKVRVTNLKVSKVHLKTADGSADYVRDLETEIGMTATELQGTVSGTTSSAEAYPHVGFEVDDPRENLYQGSLTDENAMNWRKIESAVSATDSEGTAMNANTSPEKIAGFTFNARNAFCNPTNTDATADKDLESATEPENISSAYIRNKPMMSLAELGAIHRGVKWQTINLRKSATRIWHDKYDPERTDLDNADGYTYSDGDAAILDQVKLTPLVYSAGKVNLNIYPDTDNNNFLFKALFKNIRWKVDHHADYEGGDSTTRVGDDQAESLCSTLGSNVRTRGYFLSRGHYVDYMTTHNSGNFSAIDLPQTDAQNEIIPAVSAGLTSTYATSPSIIQYIVVAQSIRDVGTKDGIDMTRVKQDGSDTLTQKVKSGVFDYNSGVYFDEITGETKMLVTIQIDEANGKVKLLKKEYID